jgi:hypothetical protein
MKTEPDLWSLIKEKFHLLSKLFKIVIPKGYFTSADGTKYRIRPDGSRYRISGKGGRGRRIVAR